MTPTNDQKRMAEVLPLVEGADPGSATLLSRMFLQGADPLFIAKMAQNGVRILAHGLGISPHEVMVAIEGAHKMGPGIFCGEDGSWSGEVEDFEPHHAAEVAWLVLASFSHDNEHGYTNQSAEERMALAFRHVLAFNSWAETLMVEASHKDINEFRQWKLQQILEFAAHKLADFRGATEFRMDGGVPTTDQDVGFYIGYKRGFTCVAVEAPGMTFYGCPPGHTLEGEGVKVDKQISPQFGIVFG